MRLQDSVFVLNNLLLESKILHANVVSQATKIQDVPAEAGCDCPCDAGCIEQIIEVLRVELDLPIEGELRILRLPPYETGRGLLTERDVRPSRANQTGQATKTLRKACPPRSALHRNVQRGQKRTGDTTPSILD